MELWKLQKIPLQICLILLEGNLESESEDVLNNIDFKRYEDRIPSALHSIA